MFTNKTNPKENFSKILEECRSLAIAISKNTNIGIKYDALQPTSSFNMENNDITLSLTPYPSFVRDNPILFKKVLDGDLAHEVGHLLLTKPLWEYYNNWVTRIKRNRGYYKLAHEICNIVEDMRVNHFIILRYRFDVGKRLLLANLILKDMIDNAIEEKHIPTSTVLPKDKELVSLTSNNDEVAQTLIQAGQQDGVYIVAILSNQGLYEGKCTQLWNKLSSEGKKDCESALKILEEVKYKRLRIDIMRASQEIYDLIAKNLKEDYTSKTYIVSRCGGSLKGEMSEKLKSILENELKIEMDEAERNKHLEDVQKGTSVCEGTGNEIPAPQPNYANYSVLLDECKPQITELLNQLKVKMKPQISRQVFQKRGRLMSPIIPKIYTNSLRGTVKNVYTNVSTKFEKEQIAIAFAFDFSGSVDTHEAEKITTILNEVFGHYVDDYGFAISCFGADTQKIKTFFESFDNTRARVGAISVNAGGTEVAVLLEAYLRMFNTIRGERRKILVIASDFQFSDEEKALELIGMYSRMGIECIFIGFGSCGNLENFATQIRGLKARRVKIQTVSELPQAFLNVYLNTQR